MSIIKKMRKQKAVWWQRSALPDQYGTYSYAAPIEIDCRWDDTTQEYRHPKGQVEMSNAVVYVDREMAVGDMLMKGEWESDTPDNPLELDSGVFEIQRFDNNPNIKATEFLLTAFL